MMTSIAAVIPMAAGFGVTSLEGYKLDDATGAGLEGWTIIATSGFFGSVFQNITDDTGYWKISGLNSDENYTVTEVLQPGWNQVEPVTGSWIVGPGLDDVGNLNFTNRKSPQVPVMTPLGMLALVCLLSAIATMSIIDLLRNNKPRTN